SIHSSNCRSSSRRASRNRKAEISSTEIAATAGADMVRPFVCWGGSGCRRSGAGGRGPVRQEGFLRLLRGGLGVQGPAHRLEPVAVLHRVQPLVLRLGAGGEHVVHTEPACGLVGPLELV